MNLINKVFNIVAPPFTFISLCLFVPPFQVLKFFLSVLHSFFFTEDVTGKVVIITGAASGIGEELAYEYARRGSCLVLADQQAKSLSQVADMCLEIGSPDAIAVTADVTDVQHCKRIVDSAISRFGRLDHLICNAGILSFNMVEDYEDITKTRSVMDVNFWGSVHMTRLAIPQLRNTRGKIIAMASSASWLPVPRMSIYNASKAAVVAFYETLRVEVGSDIHITIVTPGLVDSEMTKGKHLTRDGRMSVDQNVRDVLVNVLPLSNAEDCAKAIVNGACQGKRRVVEPAWYGQTYWLERFFPEVADKVFRLLYLPKLRDSATEPLSRRILGLLGLKAVLHPPSIPSPEMKTE